MHIQHAVYAHYLRHDASICPIANLVRFGFQTQYWVYHADDLLVLLHVKVKRSLAN